MKHYLDLRPLPPNIVTPQLHKQLLHQTSIRSDHLIAIEPGESALSDKNASRLAMKSITEISR
jgi:hypothetical protein